MKPIKPSIISKPTAAITVAMTLFVAGLTVSVPTSVKGQGEGHYALRDALHISTADESRRW